MSPPRVAVVGGGIAGLATAYRVLEEARSHAFPLDVTLLEADARVGGNIQTEVLDGFTVEWGPNGFLDNVPSTLTLARDVGLEDALQPADAKAAKRYIWRNGALHLLPSGPGSFVSSPVLSLRGRLRVLMEPLQPRGPVDEDESVRDFGVRRIGAEAADVLIDAMVSGVFAGDASSLSLPSAFPKMRAMEAQHGSLVRAMVAGMRARRGSRNGGGGGGGPAGPGGTLTSFRDGLETLPRALAAALGGRVRTSTAVRALSPAHEGGWRLSLDGGESLVADEVMLAVPARAAARLLRGLKEELGDTLDETPMAGLAVVALGFPAEAMAAAPDGFGFLAPRSEGLRMLGCLFDSSIFPGRAPEGMALLRVMIGGAHDPGAVELSDAELREVVLQELRSTVGISQDPVFTEVIRHPLGIAQYNVGHGDRLRRLAELLEPLPGLALTGSAFHGVAMNACVARAEDDARALVGRLMQQQDL